MHERVSNEEYKKLRERDMAITMELIDAINTSPDPRVGSRDSRPILDIKHMLETSTELYGDNIAFYQMRFYRNVQFLFDAQDRRFHVVSSVFLISSSQG